MPLVAFQTLKAATYDVRVFHQIKGIVVLGTVIYSSRKEKISPKWPLKERLSGTSDLVVWEDRLQIVSVVMYFTTSLV